MNTPRERLRVAVQKSGRLAQPARELLARCGLRFREDRDRLFCFGEGLAIDLLLVRDDDIPDLLAGGSADLGIVGRNVLLEDALGREEAGAPRELRALGFGGCRLSLAVPQDWDWAGPAMLAGQRIATSFPRLLRRWLAERGIVAEVVTLAGSVEIAPRLGTADAICDLVSSGATLHANRLREVAEVLASEAVLAATAVPAEGVRSELQALFLRRLDAVLGLRETRLVLLQAPRSALADIAELLPGRPAPLVSPIEGQPGRVALQALCSGSVGWNELEAMRQAGASALLVLPVEKMLA